MNIIKQISLKSNIKNLNTMCKNPLTFPYFLSTQKTLKFHCNTQIYNELYQVRKVTKFDQKKKL